MDQSSANARAETADAVSALLTWARDTMEPAAPADRDIADRLAASSEGGKAFRARLLLETFDACGGDDRDAAVELAAAVELFQTAALIHDDVLDGSDTRRGMPAAHRAFEQQHRAAGWHGDAAAYGRAGAILAGDVALMAARRGVALAERRVGARVGDLYDQMALLVTAGQHLDMRVAAAPLSDLPSQEDAIRATMRAKTASYTAEFPLALGAAAAGDDAAIDTLRAAGVPLGIAFQLRDDVLGVVGTSTVTGKPVGDDLREGKRTLIVWRALTHSTAAERDAILAVLGRDHAAADDLDVAREALRTSGALDYVEGEIRRHADSARRALADVLPAATGVLALVDAAVSRSA